MRRRHPSEPCETPNPRAGPFRKGRRQGSGVRRPDRRGWKMSNTDDPSSSGTPTSETIKLEAADRQDDARGVHHEIPWTDCRRTGPDTDVRFRSAPLQPVCGLRHVLREVMRCDRPSPTRHESGMRDPRSISIPIHRGGGCDIPHCTP